MAGVKTAFLNEDGTFPVASDALNMAVMYGARMSAAKWAAGPDRIACWKTHLSASGHLRLSVSRTKESRHRESSSAENTGDGAFCVERHTSSTFFVK